MSSSNHSVQNRVPFLPVFIVLSFIVWLFAFRGFVFGKLTLVADAVPYYDHFKFYIDHLLQGVYPLWDPYRQPFGFPNEFFLRRIGSFNPFYSLIALFYKGGLTFVLSYLFFLSLYYWFCMIGFFLLARRILKDEFCAFAAYLLLMFSSLSTILFSSFLLLPTVPIVWFFYFFVCFLEKQERWSCVGMVFCWMIIVTTYLPFYFLHLFLSFLLCYAVICGKECIHHLKNAGDFIRQNKIFVLVCGVLFLLALIPGYLFFQEAARGETVMPFRHLDSSSQNVIAVGRQTYIDGGIMATGMTNELFSYLRQIRLGTFYIPPVIFILLLFGLFVSLNKKISVLALWGWMVFLTGLYEATPLYQFLYDHVFYMKYMRNFQYFLWLNTLPVLILIAAEHLRLFLERQSNSKRRKWVEIVLVLLCHALFLFYLLTIDHVLMSSFVCLSLSLIFCLVSIQYGIKRHAVAAGVVFLLIVLQPLEVYHYLGKNSLTLTEPYAYDNLREEFNLPDDKVVEESQFSKKKQILRGDFAGERLTQTAEREALPNSWLSLRNNMLYADLINPHVQRFYPLSTLMLVDQVERMDPINRGRINQALLDEKNVAFLSKDEPVSSYEDRPDAPYGQQSALIFKDSNDVKVVHFDANQVVLKTNLNKPKFLVYHDNFHSGWNVSIDGVKAHLYKANVTFKGVWVPAGQKEVVFQFGETWQFGMNYFYLILFWSVFIYLVRLIIKNRSKSQPF